MTRSRGPGLFPLLGLLATLPFVPLGAQGFQAIDAAVADGIGKRIYPGAVVVVGRADTILYARGYGHFTWQNSSPRPDTATTLWDVASLTKVVATTASAAVLVDRRQLDLDAPVGRYLPQFQGGAKDRVTVRMLLDHTSGLPAGAPSLLNEPTPAAARDKLVTIPLARTPGTEVIYSDVNAMLAGLVVEKVAGMALDSFAQRAVFQPLGMTSTQWRPVRADHVRTVPTSQFRNTPIAGEVNDPTARAMGGIAGHAGLFSTGMDLARYLQSWLRATRPASARDVWAQSGTLTALLQRSPKSGSRVIGWDTPSLVAGSSFSLFGRCATEATAGHTGWTGTLAWFDRQTDLFVVFLTNRSFDPASPTASFAQLKEVRAAVSDAARRATGERCLG